MFAVQPKKPKKNLGKIIITVEKTLEIYKG